LIDGKGLEYNFICQAGGFHVLLGRFSRRKNKTSEFSTFLEKSNGKYSKFRLHQVMAIFPDNKNRGLSS